MPAHLRPIVKKKCGHFNCSREATQTLYNTRNAEINDFCDTHGKLALEDFQAREALNKR